MTFSKNFLSVFAFRNALALNIGALRKRMLKHECPEEEIICSNEGCSLIIKQKDKEMHAKVCLYKVVQCSISHHRTTLIDMEIHMDFYCPEGKMTCLLNVNCE